MDKPLHPTEKPQSSPSNEVCVYGHGRNVHLIPYNGETGPCVLCTHAPWLEHCKAFHPAKKWGFVQEAARTAQLERYAGCDEEEDNE